MATTQKVMRLEIDDDGIAIVTINVPRARQNTLKESFAPDFEELLEELEAGDARALIIRSSKRNSFMAGADISMLRKAKDSAAVTGMAKRGQDAFDRLSKLPMPTIAAIHGACLGGGLELVLACDSRVCTDHASSVLGVPEVQLGLLPGAGGTQRLPRLIGIAPALDLMLTGKRVRPKKAGKIGLVDEVVPEAHLMRAARRRAEQLSSQGEDRDTPLARFGEILKDVASPDGARDLVLEDNALGRRVLFQQARKKLREKSLGNYPAPERIIDAVEVGIEHGFQEGLELEARFFGELAMTNEARQLMNIYFATQALKKDNGVRDRKQKGRDVSNVAVLGAGLMGSGIANVSVDKAGVPVRLRDRDDDGLGRGMKAVHGYFSKKAKRGHLSRHEAERLTRTVSTTTDYSGFGSCDLVIEAVFEDLDLKHRVLRETEEATGPHTIFGSNTSSIPIAKIAEASSRPENVIGLHYFSPVEKMPLLEIIRTDQTSDEVVATCVAFGKAQGKTVIVVRDGVGFYTSRILSPYMNEAARVVAEDGAAVEAVDRALTHFGFPVGPITLLDEVGIDVGEKVGRIMIDAYGERMQPPAIMERLIEDDRMGRKNGRGFYTYEDGRKKGVDPSIYNLLDTAGDARIDPSQVADRCALLMVNEAARCLEEDILRSPRDGDIGAIFGLGFPPFRGGPFRYVDTLGADVVVERMERLADTFGERFRPAQILRDYAEKNRTFHRD